MVRYASGLAAISAACKLVNTFSDAWEQEEETHPQKVDSSKAGAGSAESASPPAKVQELQDACGVDPHLKSAALPVLLQAQVGDAVQDLTSPQLAQRPEIHQHESQQVHVALLLAFAGWRAQQRQSKTRHLEAAEELGRSTVRNRDPSSSVLCPSAVRSQIRNSFCVWHDLRTPRGSEQRASTSPDASTSPVSPAPLQRALGALLSATQQAFNRACFYAWKGRVSQAKQRTAAALWLMERFARTRSSLVLQGLFRSWCRVAAQNRLPPWAVDLQQGLQLLTRREPHEVDGAGQKGERATGGAGLGQTLRNPLAGLAFAVICACSLLSHGLLLARHGGGHAAALSRTPPASGAGGRFDGGRPDGDGDGVRDDHDQCPSTAKRHNFRSTWHTDWDGDGCMDSVEDTDDDNDYIPNSRDLCPRTVASQGVADHEGCTPVQRESLQGGARYDHVQKLGEIIVEVALGAMLTATLNYRQPIVETVKSWGRILHVCTA